MANLVGLILFLAFVLVFASAYAVLLWHQLNPDREDDHAER